MKALSNRKTLAMACSVGAVGIGAVIAACSGGSSSNGGNTGGDGGGTTTQTLSCSNPTINISFSPMFSAYIPGSTAQTFQIPAVTDATSSVTWGASDTSKVTIAAAPDLPGGNGAMITITGTGTVNVIAKQADGTCGAAALNITQNTEDDWNAGNARYNNGNSLHFGPPKGDAGGQDGGPACTNCHGPTANSGFGFNDVSHTPEQTGGFSDDDLVQIVVHGVIPEGGANNPSFDPNVLIADASADPTGAAQLKAYQRWQSFHHWDDITLDQQPGIIVYLRSLTPAPQMGNYNFPGFGDGGHHHEGGGGHFEGGTGFDAGPPPVTDDSGGGSPADTGAPVTDATTD